MEIAYMVIAGETRELSPESQAVRFLAREKISEYFQIDLPNIEIRIDDAGAPVAVESGRQMPVSLSFSHHGTVVAVSMGLTVN